MMFSSNSIDGLEVQSGEAALSAVELKHREQTARRAKLTLLSTIGVALLVWVALFANGGSNNINESHSQQAEARKLQQSIYKDPFKQLQQNQTKQDRNRQSNVDGKNATNKNKNTGQQQSSVKGSSSSGGSQSSSSRIEMAKFKGTFNGSLPLYGEGVVDGYSGNVELLRRDLENAAALYLNMIVQQNTVDYNSYYGSPMPAPTMEAVSSEGEAGQEAQKAVSTVDSDGTGNGGGVSDFGTNLQEDDVDEGDVIKSDGKYVYAAYGDFIVVWDALTGERIADYRLPSIVNTELDAQNTTSGKMAANPYMSYIPPYPYYPKPSIQSMMLLDDRLIVAASGYGYTYLQNGMFTPVLSDYRATRVYVFDISKLEGANSTLGVLGSQDVNGYLNVMRAIGNNVHVITTSSVNPYTYLSDPIQRYNFPPETTDEMYINEVKKIAQNRTISEFSNMLIDELMIQGELPDISRLNYMQTQWNDTMATSMSLYPSGLFGYIVQIFSFDGSQVDNGEIDMSASGAFMPFYPSGVYAADNAAIIAAQGYDYRPYYMGSNQFTYLMAFDLEGASSSPNSVGQVPGTLMNSYAVDVVDDVLRIGTTESQWGGGGWWPQPMPIDIIATEEVVEIDMEATTEEGDNGGRRLQGDSDEVPVNRIPTEPPAPTASPVNIPINTVPPRTESLTTNYITMLRLPGGNDTGAGEMEQLGQLKLGKKDEMFTSIRFFDDIAYAVTFLRRDPFYALDLSDPRNPKILGELNITGFSNYLHSMNEDNTLLVAVGEESNDEGVILGLQISVFDVTDPANPVVAQRYVLERDPDTWSSTSAAWDFYAIRYEPTTSRLIIPVDISNYEKPSQDFNGFAIFKVSVDEIKQECRVQHGTNNYYYGGGYCSCGYLPARSLIFNGDVTTIKDQYVRSTDLDTCAGVWDFKISIDGCCSF